MIELPVLSCILYPVSSALPLVPEFLGLLEYFLDGADHVEGLLGDVVVLAGNDLLETLDGVLQLDVDTRGASEGLGNVEGLGEEALDLAGTGDDQFILLGELVMVNGEIGFLPRRHTKECLTALCFMGDCRIKLP